MTELVERYVHQVGHHLPKKEREDIQAELRSLIQDQLDDRYAGSPSQAQVASILAEFGDPREMAASYSSEQYLVGPDLYPHLMMALRYSLPRVPAIVVFMNIARALAASREGTLLGLFLETLLVAVLATLIFSAVIVLIFAMMQHSDVELDGEEAVFNPLDLPEVDDPARVERSDVGVGMALAVFFGFVMIYFLRVGGLTLRFNLNDPGEVVPVPTVWMILLIFVVFGQIVLNFMALRRDRWNVGLLLSVTALELFGAICLYFVILEPLGEHFTSTSETLNSIPLINLAPEFIAGISIFSGLNSEGRKLRRLWKHTNPNTLPIVAQTDA